MTRPSRRHPLPFFVHVLGLAVFAQGTSEFMLSGLAPDISRDLSVPAGAAASLTSAYAIGMIVGAPLTAVTGTRRPRLAPAAFLVAFVAAHAVGALTTDFAVLFCTRVVAAVANAGFLAVALSVAPALVAPERRARATAVLLSGVTLACVAGVPAGALLGERYGWRAAFWAVGALCLPALVLVLRYAPADAPVPSRVPVRRELRVLGARPVRRTLLLAALTNGATFATFAHLGLLGVEVAGLPDGAVPALLAVFGAGSFLGVTAAGRAGEEARRRGLLVSLCLLPPAWAALAVAGVRAVPLFVLAPVLGGLSFGAGSALVGRILSLTTRAPALGGASATVALNAGAFAGPLLAAAAAGATGDHRAAVRTSAVLAVLALAAAAASARAGRTASASGDARP
ncbi:Cmx/CmrA family chloramphenicol efflux MFS transporter [Streptomyces sp.]|uniref:Cmx/CmrA family chloramphenicol efflux MFS transporter n=1 Tax=Streptomyces sp. TaxID=1931 RepID=UPI002811C097|nr:Cmx/CmrA family chloramphenicol efflux MFS transporter [Streptomyces sp.]